jgi:hypothetical protein
MGAFHLAILLISLASIHLWRRGLGRGGSFFDGRFMGRRLLHKAILSPSLPALVGCYPSMSKEFARK